MEEITAQAEETINVELPVTQTNESQPLIEEAPPTPSRIVEDVEIPTVEEEIIAVEMSDVEVEFRALVTELMDAGVEPTDMMDDPRWEDISERAMATGFETWPVFLELTAVQ